MQPKKTNYQAGLSLTNYNEKQGFPKNIGLKYFYA